MKLSAFISILSGFTFAIFIMYLVRGEFDWVTWIGLLLGAVIAYLGIKYLKFKGTA
jgi:hypothetical protein